MKYAAEIESQESKGATDMGAITEEEFKKSNSKLYYYVMNNF